MQYDMRPQLSTEARDAFGKIIDWLAGGGKANDTIQFNYAWKHGACCVGGALLYLLDRRGGGWPSADIVAHGVSHGMRPADAEAIFVDVEAGGSQSPQEMATVLRHWLDTGRLCFAETGV